ncbi:MAG: histidine phosphatase family protein [Lachnospiraceae bacterium]
MKLYIMRHGETDWNKERRLQGQADIPLNASGRKIARETSKGMAHLMFDAAYTSPLVRAKETARLVIDSRNIPLQVDERLKEMSFGPYEGLCCARDNWEIPDKGFENFFFAPDRYQPPKGADSFKTVLDRVSLFIEEVVRIQPPDSNILVVGHGVVVGAFLAIAENRSIAEFWQDRVQKNCAVNIFDVKENKYRMLEKNIIFYQEDIKEW